MADDSFLDTASLALLVQKILLRESSEEYPLTISDILKKLQQYNIFPDRRRVKDILELFYSYSQKYPESLFTARILIASATTKDKVVTHGSTMALTTTFIERISMGHYSHLSIEEREDIMVWWKNHESISHRPLID